MKQKTRYSQQAQRNPIAHGQAINSENSINQEYLERNQIQDAANVNTNAGTNPEMLGRDTTNNVLYQEARQGRSRQTSVQGSCQRVMTSENSINLNNQPPIQNIHREYSNVEGNVLSKGQFFAPQRRHKQGERKSKAVQVDHVEKQYVIKRNTFSGKNPLYIEDTKSPVFVNNYYVLDNRQQMFCEERGDPWGRSDNSNYRLQQAQTQNVKQDKASQSMDDWGVGVARMHRMEETHQTLEDYHNNQGPPVIVQPNKMQELTPSSTRSYQMPDYSVPPPSTQTYKSPPDDSLLPGQQN